MSASASQVARRYARALAELADESAALDRVARDLEALRPLLLDPRLLRVMSTPVFTHAERRALLASLLEGRELHPHTRRFFSLLLDKGRFALLPEILEAFDAWMDRHLGRLRAHLLSADPLPESESRRILEALERATGRSVLLSRATDPSLLAGLVVQVGDRVFDASLRTRLDALAQSLSSVSVGAGSARPTA